MGLRINTNIPTLIALRNLSITDARQQQVFERLSTGLKINRAADDPTGLALSETLRTQIKSLEKATENNQSASNLLNTADSALAEVQTILTQLRDSFLFAMDGAATPQQIQTEQQFVDSSLNALSRIASTTRFGDVPLLNGQSGFTTQSVSSAGIRDIRAFEAKFNPVSDPTTFSLNLTTPATQASTVIASGVVGGDVTLTITGPRGTVTLPFSAGATAADVAAGIDGTRGFTGLFAVGTTIFSEDFGSAATIRLENSTGAGTVNGLPPGGVSTAAGVDAVATFEGFTFNGVGNTLAVDTPNFRGVIELQPGALPSPPAYTFDIARSGTLLQLGANATPGQQMTLNIPDVSPSSLGMPAITIGGQTFDGFLSSLSTGGANDLTANPGNGIRIIDLAVAQISAVRSTLGSTASEIVEPAQRAHEVAIENLTASESDLRDADFAAELAQQTRNDILFQAGIAVLAQATSLPRSVLELLQ